MISTKVIFDHRGRAKTNEEGPVEVRVIVNRKPYYISTGVRVKATEWNDRTQHVIQHKDREDMNERIDSFETRVKAVINEMLADGVPVDAAGIKARVWMKGVDAEAERTAFVDWVDDQIKLLSIKAVTKNRYRVLVHRLREYGGLLAWRDLTVENIYKWDTWLHGLDRPVTEADRLTGKEPGKIGDSTVNNYHKSMKCMLNRAVEFGYIKQNPYDRLRGKFRRGDRETVNYLTEEEMQSFLRLEPEEGTRERLAKDLFVFQMYTGLSYSDTQAFDMGDYRKVDGVWVNTGERIKTGVAYISQLLPPVVAVLEKYGWRVPKMGNADYNRLLKDLGKKAKINVPLHSHMARHTFATYMLSNGVKIQNVSRMLGHTNITQTQRYAKVMAKSVHEDFAMIAEKFSNYNDR